MGNAVTGMVYIGDVGQGAREEISVQPHTTRGLNYGWNIMEGTACYNATTCNQTGLTPPLIDYNTHVAGTCAVTGGYVYRGTAIPGLIGHYLYSDYCARWLRSFRYSNGQAVDQKVWDVTSPGSVSSFGVDYDGELYLIGGSVIYRIVAENLTVAL